MEANTVVVSSNYMRAVLSRALIALGISLDSFIITERTLRVEAVLAEGQNSYEFNLYENTNERPLEVKLNRNDGFIVSHLGLGIAKQDETTTPKRYGNFPVFTYPDPNYFVGQNVAGTVLEHQALETLYNAKLSLNATNIDVIDAFPTELLRYVPERGYLLPAAPQVRHEFPQSGPSLEERGLYPYSINNILNGQLNNTLKISGIKGDTQLIQGGTNVAGAAVTTSNVVVLKLHGFQIAGAAQAGLKWGTF